MSSERAEGVSPDSAATRPFPPGEYPVVVVGSGPGGLQMSYSLRRLGIPHATISADPAPGGMFRRWPHFQRLLSWTKPYAPEERTSRAYQRYDWNSLLADEVDSQAVALQASFMDGSSYFPARPEMEANLAAFAERTELEVRYDCRWLSTRREETPDGERFVLVTSDGEYRCRVADLRRRRRRAMGAADAGHRARSFVRHGPAGRDIRRPADLHHRQAELGDGAGVGPAPVGGLDRPRVAVAGQALGRHEVARRGQGALSPTVRGQRPRRRRRHPQRLDRVDRAGRWRPAGARPPDRHRRAAVVPRRRRHRGDRFPLPPARPARPWRRDVRPEQAAGSDDMVGERDRARDLLRRHDHPGPARSEEARHPAELGRRPRGALQRPDPGPPDRRDAVRAVDARDRRSTPRASSTGSSTRPPAAPSCGTRRRSSPGSCRSRRTPASATRASCRSPPTSTRGRPATARR